MTPNSVPPSVEAGSEVVRIPSTSAIEVRGLTRRYGSVLALDHLDLDVPLGSVFGLLGPNGAGKTTTLRLLTGLGRPTSGSARVAGIPMGTHPQELARHIGYLDQQPRLFGWMTGRELLEFAGQLHGMRGPALRSRIEEVLDLIGLADAGARRIAGYSGGMRQRLGIGQSILHRPEVVFLDEPVSALDPEGRRDVLRIVDGLRSTSTVLMSTHILADVERVCDRVAIVDHGHLVTEAPIGELLERFARPAYEIELEPGQGARAGRLADLLRSASWVRRVDVAGDGLRVLVIDPMVAADAILSVVAHARVRVARLERVRPSLEDVFLQLVGRDNTATMEAA